MERKINNIFILLGNMNYINFLRKASLKVNTSFLNNTILSISGKGLNIAVQGLYFILLARGLGPNEYGAFAAVLALSRVFSAFATWGYGNILIKNVSRNPNKFPSYWGAGVLITCICGGCFTILTLVISKFYIHLSLSIVAIVLISTTDLILSGLQSLCQQAYQSFDKMNRVVQIQNTTSVFRLIGMVSLILIIKFPTATSWSYLYFLTGFIPSVCAVFLVNKELGYFKFGVDIRKEEFLEGFYFSVSKASHSLYNDIDKTLLASMASVEITGLYSAAYRFIDFSFAPIDGLLTSAYTNYFKHGKNGVKGGVNWALKLIPWSATYGLLASILLFSLAGLIPFFIGPSYQETAVILKWLSPIIFFKSIQYLVADVLTGSDHQFVRTIIQLSVALENFIVTVWLIPIYGWLGAAIASVTSDALAVIVYSFVVFIMIKRERNDKA